MNPRIWLLFSNPLANNRGLSVTVWMATVVFTLASGYRAGCSVDDFRSHLTRVCAIYSKRSTEFHMRPLLEDQRKPSGEFETLWGYYMREWQASQDTATEPVGMLYQINREQDGSGIPVQIPNLPAVQSLPPGASVKPAHLIPADPNQVTQTADPASPDHHGGVVAYHIKVLPNEGQPQLQQYFDPLMERWRRNAMLKNLVVKCCSKGCIPGDFVAVAQEYSICPGIVP